MVGAAEGGSPDDPLNGDVFRLLAVLADLLLAGHWVAVCRSDCVVDEVKLPVAADPLVWADFHSLHGAGVPGGVLDASRPA